MTNIDIQKETAIHDEQQSVSKKEIIDTIISILTENNLSITEARDILNITSKKLGQQMVKASF